MEISLKKVSEILVAPISSASSEVVINHIEFDSRKVTPGALFVPLQGQRDGHEFINAAVQQGAVATLVEKGHSTDKIKVPFVVVDNVLDAILKISSYCLKVINPKVVAITGSNGKTTTKDLVYSILAQKFRVWRTKDNFNNEIGIPYTIISMPQDTQILTIEIGIDGFNQMEELANLVKPDIAIITMIGEAHIEFFKNRNAIALEKLKIAQYLKPEGILLINGDEPLLLKNSSNIKATVKTFGESRRDDIYPFDIKTTIDKSSYHTNLTDNETLTIPLIGKYNIVNSLAAIQVAKHFKMTDEEIKTGLKMLQLTKDRVEWFTGKKGEKILDDAYNSNPTALKVILAVFRDLKIEPNEKKYVVLGDMLELGEESKDFHANIAASLPPNIFDKIYLYGTEISALNDKLKPIYQSRLHYFPIDQFSKLEQALQQEVDDKTYLLIKASHGLHLERLVNSLTNNK
ncbi:UDP-N-acetylmuramoyl-tripeptide--D-alanyl-D-alanine ligase [Xylocopilactobacillus apicola]|uniref:UDP-N-acetylmuramoyl-tripeptide--D-alanyl-D-alanine ligase n=1 Tax=Xylocopilactobacillus apicola TaxID=2932184 RepID=A0AAU9DCE4_9LACO|nr:UDP-N-acetylmuramoyl-tripeptide--D-alanyl-D-alanine ligase [Xylocopilactobacillus apicola]BDR58472.1 UDP-N-acetylmuramoyl-tripeptide--D-alanyl-D-alanine ligase [Xylocopilactobacillus apicola]